MQAPSTLATLKPLIPRIYLPTFLAAFGQGMLVPTLPLFVAGLGVNFTLVTLAIATAALGTLVWNVPSGLLLARGGERRMQLIGMGVLAVATLLLGFTTAYPLVIAYRALAGTGMAMWVLSRMAYMLRATPSHQRGRVMSLFGGISRIAMFASPAAGGALADQFGFTVAFLVAGVVTAAGLIPTLLLAEPDTGLRAQVGRPPPGWREIVRVVRRQFHDLLTAGFGQLLSAAIRSGRQVMIPLYAAFALDLDATAVGVAVSASAAIDMTLFPVAGYLMDRLGRKFATVPCFALFGLSMGLLPLARDFTGLVAIAMLMGFANGIGSGTMLTLGSDLAPRDAPHEFLGVWRLIGDIGSTGGPLVVGVVADGIGLASAPFFMAGVGLAAAFTFGVLVRETLVKPRPAPIDSS